LWGLCCRRRLAFSIFALRLELRSAFENLVLPHYNVASGPVVSANLITAINRRLFEGRR